MGACDYCQNYCKQKRLYICSEGYERHNDCKSFRLDWEKLSEKDKVTIQRILQERK